MHWWVTGTVLGMLPVAWLASLPGWYLPLSLLVLASLVTARCPHLARFCLGLALGSSVAIYHGEQLLGHRLPGDCVLETVMVTGDIASLPRSTRMPDQGLRQRFEFRPQVVVPPRCAGPRRLLLSYYGPQRLVPGERWRFEARLKKPWGLANPGSFNMQSWFAQTGIDAVGSVRGRRAERLAASTSLRWWHHRLRMAVSDRIATLAVPADVRAVLRAITVADKSGIDHRLWTVLQIYGVNHLLVISGLHIGLVAAAGLLLGGLLQRGAVLAGLPLLWLPPVLALVLAVGYAALAGFSLSTQRALCMLLCFLLARLAGRSSSAASNLLLAAFVLLCLNPLAGLGSGFWLSFGAVAALLWLGCWRPGLGLPGRVLQTHGFMALVMVPMGSWWFGGASLVAALANLLMIPLIGLLVVPAALLATLAFLVGWPGEGLLWQLAGWPMRQLLPLAVGLGERGQPWLYQPLVATLPAVLLALAGVAIFACPTTRRVRAVAALLWLPLLLPNEDSNARADGATRVAVLDVGQGTAVLIQAGHHALLYDTGGGDPAGANMANAVLLPYLRRRGIRRLSTLVISHPDQDHSAGVATILQALPVAQFYFGQPLAGIDRGRPCVAGQAWRWPGGQRFQFLSPARESGLASNDASCVLQIEIGDHRLLIPGDIGSDRERELVAYWRDSLRSDWLLLAHHGSQTSTSPALLKSVRPGVVIINSGYANRFGHPHPLVLERLHHNGTRILSTAAGGALEFEFIPGRAPRVESWRQRQRRFWM